MSIRHFDLLTEIFQYCDFRTIREMSRLNRKMFAFCCNPKIKHFIRLTWRDHILDTYIVDDKTIYYDKLFKACEKANDYEPIVRLIPLIPLLSWTYDAIKAACDGGHCRILQMMLENDDYTLDIYGYSELLEASNLKNYELVQVLLASPKMCLENFFRRVILLTWIPNYDVEKLNLAFKNLDIQMLNTFKKDVEGEINVKNSSLEYFNLLDDILFFVRTKLTEIKHNSLKSI